jgi:hypothetical protein
MQPIARHLVSIVAVSILVSLTSLPAVAAQANPAAPSGALTRMSMGSTIGVSPDERLQRVTRTTRRCAPWPSDGFAFSIAAGRPGHPTTSPPTSMHSSAAARDYSLR